MSVQGSMRVGFLTILEEETGYLGGYLVTNTWGRPLEFRLSTAVRPNRIQEMLYAETLRPYLCADLIGKTLVEKTTTDAHLIVTDNNVVLELRRHLEVPLIWLTDDATTSERLPLQLPDHDHPIGFCHERFPDDVEISQDQLTTLEGQIDLREPFTRIREAIGEARKIGATNRN